MGSSIHFARISYCFLIPRRTLGCVLANISGAELSMFESWAQAFTWSGPAMTWPGRNAKQEEVIPASIPFFSLLRNKRWSAVIQGNEPRTRVLVVPSTPLDCEATQVFQGFAEPAQQLELSYGPLRDIRTCQWVGWIRLRRFSPTPGRSMIQGIPSGSRTRGSPIPETSSNWGVWNVPDPSR